MPEAFTNSWSLAVRRFALSSQEIPQRGNREETGCLTEKGFTKNAPRSVIQLAVGSYTSDGAVVPRCDRS